MKKILSLGLVGVMALSMIPTAFATTDYTNGTKVQYVGTGDAEYTITVPALLKPSGSGTVTLEGTWASDCEVVVTADQSVTLTNSINPNDKKVLTVSFDGISALGSNVDTIVATETVSVGAIDNAIFGTWSGKFNYNVEFNSSEFGFEIIIADNMGTVSEEWGARVGMTWREFVNENSSTFSINDDGTVRWQWGRIGIGTDLVHADDVIQQIDSYVGYL